MTILYPYTDTACTLFITQMEWLGPSPETKRKSINVPDLSPHSIATTEEEEEVRGQPLGGGVIVMEDM